MRENEDTTGPLPKEWLPRAAVPSEEDRDYWEQRLGRVLAEAAPALAGYRRRSATSPAWLEALALRWRPAAAGALALAASAVVAFAVGAGHHSEPGPRSIVLSAIVGEGAPASLWSGAGVPADPTLALVALESGAQRRGGDR